MTNKTNKTNTPATTKAAPDKPADGEGTKLAQVPNPAKLTDAKINEIAGKHSDPTDPEQTANVDAAETLEQNRDDAKSKDDPERGYFHGQGGAAGI
jgi:hypothetical protein